MPQAGSVVTGNAPQRGGAVSSVGGEKGRLSDQDFQARQGQTPGGGIDPAALVIIMQLIKQLGGTGGGRLSDADTQQLQGQVPQVGQIPGSAPGSNPEIQALIQLLQQLQGPNIPAPRP